MVQKFWSATQQFGINELEMDLKSIFSAPESHIGLWTACNLPIVPATFSISPHCQRECTMPSPRY